MNAVLLLLILVAGAIVLLFLSRPGKDVPQQRFRAVWFYLIFFALGFPPLLLLPIGHGAQAPFFGAAGLVAWVLLDCLWLMRRYPGIQQPAWALQPWRVADWSLILITALCELATFVG